MSHEVESMAYAGEVPWHGLGRKVSNDLAPEQMMRAVGVDWEVHKAPSYATYNGQNIPTGQKVFPHTNVKKGVENVGEAGREDRITTNAKRCLELVENQPGAEYAEGSWWQAFNSVTCFTDHVQGRSAENRLHSQWYGKN